MELELEALELLSEEHQLTGGGCETLTCGAVSCNFDTYVVASDLVG